MARPYDPHTLRLFLVVCEEGSVSRCAERESTVASAVSKRLAALEEAVGMPILRRARGGMVPTEAGRVLASHAREVLAGLERMQSTMHDMAHGAEGSVRVLASLAALSGQLPQDLVSVLSRYRSIRLSLRDAASTDLVRRVREGSADLGVCWDQADLHDLQTVPYRDDHACVIMHTAHRLARRKSLRLVDILDEEYVSAMPGSLMETNLRRHAEAAGKPISARIEVQSFQGVARIVAAGLGVSVLPREVIGPLASALKIQMVPLSDDWATRRFVVCSRAEPYCSRAARIVMEALRCEADGMPIQ